MKTITNALKVLCSICKQIFIDFHQTKESLHRVYTQFPYIRRASNSIKMIPLLIPIIYVLFLQSSLIIKPNELAIYLLSLECYLIFVELLFLLIWKLLLITSKKQQDKKVTILIVAKRTIYDSKEKELFKKGEVITEFSYSEQIDPYDLNYFVDYDIFGYLPSSNFKKS